jgi:hypothetical protein
MTDEVTPDSPTRCSITGEAMEWSAQENAWVHAHPHNWCSYHDIAHHPGRGIIEVEPALAEQMHAHDVGGYSIGGTSIEDLEPTFRQLQARSHQQSRDKGFHDYQPTDLREIASLNAERVALFHSEASEMLEEQRKGHPPTLTYYSKTEKTHNKQGRLVRETTEYFKEQSYLGDRKPEGQPAEAADMIIRIMDWAGANNVDLLAAIVEKLDYNATRAKMHGGKKF